MRNPTNMPCECPSCGVTLLIVRKPKGRCECLACGTRFNANRPFSPPVSLPRAELVNFVCRPLR
jgi:uncharacterized protein (DUF983 family)